MQEELKQPGRPLMLNHPAIDDATALKPDQQTTNIEDIKQRRPSYTGVKIQKRLS